MNKKLSFFAAVNLLIFLPVALEYILRSAIGYTSLWFHCIIPIMWVITIILIKKKKLILL